MKPRLSETMIAISQQLRGAKVQQVSTLPDGATRIEFTPRLPCLIVRGEILARPGAAIPPWDSLADCYLVGGGLMPGDKAFLVFAAHPDVDLLSPVGITNGQPVLVTWAALQLPEDAAHE